MAQKLIPVSRATVGRENLTYCVSRLRSAFIWLFTAALAAGYCGYRISVFRPLPLDSPGTLRPVLYGWFSSYTGLFRNTDAAWFFWHSACYAALLTFPLLALLSYLWSRHRVRLPGRTAAILLSQSLFWLLYAGCLFLCRYPMLLRNELNPDEGQFLASACKLFYDPVFFHSVDCHTSGPGNIFPLMTPAIFGLSPDFTSGRIIGIITLFFSVYFLYRSLALITKEELARIAILPVAIAFPAFINTELVYNSSEHIPNLLISVAIFLSVRIFARPSEYRLPAFLLGLVASTAFFTKIQSVPIVGAAVVVSLGYLLANKVPGAGWRGPLLAVAGAVAPALANTVLCLRAGVLQDYWQSYVLANFQYTTPVGSAPVSQFLLWLAETPELRCFYLTVFIVIVVAIVQQLVLRPGRRGGRQIGESTPEKMRSVGRWLGLLALLSSAAALFSIYKAHRNFVHYVLFLFIPFGLTVGWVLVHEVGRITILPYVTAAMSLLSSIYLWSFQDSGAFHIAAMIRAPEGDFIRSVTQPGSKIYVWGWTALPYLASARMPATRQTLVGTLFRSYNVMTFPPVVQPTPGSERVAAYYRRRELKDLEANKPALFIDAIGPASWFLSSREYYGFERIPEIADFVKNHYTHLIDLYQERYFLRRDLAAHRDLEFSQPLPPKQCAPATVVCLDTAVTLPRELPPVHIPAHARIEVEFMPIGQQIGVATVLNNEAHPNSFRGFRLQHVSEDRYILLVGLGDRWAVSREFVLPEGKTASIAIEVSEHILRIENNGSKLDELQLARSIADSPGPVDVGSWIGGMDPFSGKIQFFEIIDCGQRKNSCLAA